MININYFKYLLKKDYKIILILFLGIFFVFPLQVIIDEPIYNEIWYSYNESEYISIGKILSSSSLCLTTSTIIILILGIFTPLVMRHMYITRKQCDTYYALPIKKETLYQTTYLFGFVVDISVWTLCFLIALCGYSIKGFSLNYGYLFLYMVCMWGFLFVQYTVSSFFSLLATNRSDASLLTIFGPLCLLMITFEICSVINILFSFKVANIINSYTEYFINPFASGFKFTSCLAQKAILIPQDIKDFISTIPEADTNFYRITNVDKIPLYVIIGLILHIIICIILQFINRYIFKEIKAERIEYISPRQVGLKVCLSIFIIFLFSLCDFTFPFPSIFIIANALLFYFIGQFYIKRKIKFDKQMFILLIPLIICGIIISLGASIS